MLDRTAYDITHLCVMHCIVRN